TRAGRGDDTAEFGLFSVPAPPIQSPRAAVGGVFRSPCKNRRACLQSADLAPRAAPALPPPARSHGRAPGGEPGMKASGSPEPGTGSFGRGEGRPPLAGRPGHGGLPPAPAGARPPSPPPPPARPSPPPPA